jgi:hypothetical protein
MPVHREPWPHLPLRRRASLACGLVWASRKRVCIDVFEPSSGAHGTRRAHPACEYSPESNAHCPDRSKLTGMACILLCTVMWPLPDAAHVAEIAASAASRTAVWVYPYMAIPRWQQFEMRLSWACSPGRTGLSRPVGARINWSGQVLSGLRITHSQPSGVQQCPRKFWRSSQVQAH